MIQRIQTLYLLGAAACAALMIFLPIYYIKMPDAPVDARTGMDFIPICAAVAGFVLNALVVIFLFRNRTRQQKFLLGLFLFIAIILALIFFTWSGLKKDYPDAKIEFEFTVLLAIGMYVLVALARRAIRKDEELVKSLDRLR